MVIEGLLIAGVVYLDNVQKRRARAVNSHPASFSCSPPEVPWGASNPGEDNEHADGKIRLVRIYGRRPARPPPISTPTSSAGAPRTPAWPDFAYEIVSAGPTMVAGMMDIPAEARAMGARPSWMGYIWVEDVDAALPKLTAAGGKVFKAPADIPGVGRFAVVADPDGAAFMLFRDAGGNPPPPPPPGTPGLVGWRELHAGDGARALRVLFRPVRLEEGARLRHGADGRLSHLRHWPRRAGRHDDPHAADAGAVLALLFQRRRHRRRGRARQGERRAASSTARWKCPAANGSCRGSIRRARCSRCSRRSAEP